MTTEELLSKLRAEVERIKKSYDVYLARVTKEDFLNDLDNILSFLDTLEKEDRLPDPLQDPTPEIVGAALYGSISDILAIGFMDYLDRNRTEGKMCLSGCECDDIMKAFRKQDWKRIERYRDKYLLSKND